jgi:hypothetical protein
VAAVAGGISGAGTAAGAAEPAPRTEFWQERDAAYRESERGPFTAVLAEYLSPGESVTLVAGEEELRVDAAPPAGDRPAVRVALGDAGFTLAAIEGCAPASVRGEPLDAEAVFPEGAGDEDDVRLGPYLLSLDRQGPETGRILAYDPRRLADFHGFPVFEDSDAYRVTARVLPGNGEVVALGTTRGLEKPYVRAVVLEFRVEATECRLTGFRAQGEEDDALFVPYRDATSGGASYGVGRYLRVEPRGDGTAPVDFNRSTNPWCAYSPFYNCVLPPEENLLPVAIRAGERAPADH